MFKERIFKGHCVHTRRQNVAIEGTEQNEAIYLLFGNAHLIGDIRENRGLDKVAFIPPGASTTFQLGPFFLPTLDEVKYFFILFLINLFEKYHMKRKRNLTTCRENNCEACYGGLQNAIVKSNNQHSGQRLRFILWVYFIFI